MQIRDIAKPTTKFFFKSVYGPLSDDWPTLSFTKPQFETTLRKVYRPESDFVLFAGTTDPLKTPVSDHRGKLLSLMTVSLAKVERTEDFVPPDVWRLAQRTNPGQWAKSFGILDGWRLLNAPSSTSVLPRSFSVMGQFPYVGSVKEIDKEERENVLDLHIEQLHLKLQPAMQLPLHLKQLKDNKDLNETVFRLADLIQNRVDAAGSLQTRTAPFRSALPRTELMQLIAAKLGANPLLCELCGGVLPLKPSNRLLQPSADRTDSADGDYGPTNFQICHLACNLAKNSSSVEEYREWLETAASPLLEN